jgi:glycosyltransferase involved in cell wall biosynthesis
MHAANPMPRKKIVIVSDTIYPYFKGGKEQRILHLTTHLAKMGNDVHIYTMKWWDGPEEIIKNGVHLHGIGKMRCVYKNETRRSMRVSLLFALSCIRLLRVDFDVIDVDHMPYLQMFTVWAICKLRRRKMYATWHEVWDQNYWCEYLGKLGPIGYMIERIAGRLPDYVFANSLDTQQKLTARHPGKADRIIPAYNGINIQEINRADLVNVQCDVLYAGRLLSHKNVAMLIRAMAEVHKRRPQTSCIIVGDGPDMERLVTLTKKLGLEHIVIFTGFLADHSDVYGYMKATKLFVQPSKREGFGLVVAEANACGTPVLTLDHPDNAATHLIREGVNGTLFSSTAELSEKIIDCLERPAPDSKRITHEVQKYDWQHVALKVHEGYLL